MARCPFATWNPIRGFPGLLYILGARKCGVIHSTEGGPIYTPRGDGTYFGGASPPHFTVDTEGVWQHIDTSVASYATENRPGGVETNRYGCIQIEVCGRAQNAPTWPAATYTNLARLMRWIEDAEGVKASPYDGFHFYPPENGVLLNGREPWRIPFAEWSAVDCWVGHQHMPENVHGDPGKVRLDLLFPTKADPVPPSGPAHVTDYLEDSVKTALIGSGTAVPPYFTSDPKVARWRAPFPGRAPTPIAVVPNTLVQLRSPIGVHVEGEDLVLDIGMIDEAGNPVGAFDVWVTVA